jgi:hypothetical protein
MARTIPSAEAAADQARRAAADAAGSEWAERLARAGYATKGLIYLIVGLLALQVAIGAGGQTTDGRGVLLTILAQPFGAALLAAVAVGLVGYALWRLAQAAFDLERKGADAKGLATRAAYAVNGLAYGAFAVVAARLLLLSGGAADGEPARDWTARLLGQPFGPWLVGAIGVGVIAFGLHQAVYGLAAKFRGHFALDAMSEQERDALLTVGRAGYAARAVVLAVIGLFLIAAAMTTDPSQARGLGGALGALLHQPLGRWLLGAVATGLIGYGLYNGFEARYHRIRPPVHNSSAR